MVANPFVEAWNWLTIPNYEGPDSSGYETPEDQAADANPFGSAAQAWNSDVLTPAANAVESVLPSATEFWAGIIALIIILVLVAIILRESGL